MILTKFVKEIPNMKKLSLLLALLMVVSCFVLASCGDEETTS